MTKRKVTLKAKKGIKIHILNIALERKNNSLDAAKEFLYEIAAQVGITKTKMTRIMNNSHESLSAAELSSLADAMDVTIDQLITSEVITNEA